MNKYFYNQPHGFRFRLTDGEGCAPRVSLKPDCKCGLSIGASSQGQAQGGNQTFGNVTQDPPPDSGSDTSTYIIAGVAAVVILGAAFVFTRK